MKAKLKDGTLLDIREESSLYCIVPVETETVAVESIIQKLTNDNLSELQILDDSGTVTQSGIDFSVVRSVINEGVAHITLRHLTTIEKETHSHKNRAQLDKVNSSLFQDLTDLDQTKHSHSNKASLDQIDSAFINKAKGGGYSDIKNPEINTR